MADKDDDDLLNDLDFDKIAEDKKGNKEAATTSDALDDFDESLEDLADLDDDLLSSDDLMADIDDIDDLDDDISDDEDWDLDDDNEDFDAGPAQLSAPKRKSFIAKNFSLIIILLALGGGGGYYYTQHYLPSQGKIPTPQPTTPVTPAPIDQVNMATPEQPTIEQVANNQTPKTTLDIANNEIPDLASQTDLPPMPTPVGADIGQAETTAEIPDLVELLDPTEALSETEETIDLDFGAESLTPMPNGNDQSGLPDLVDLSIDTPEPVIAPTETIKIEAAKSAEPSKVTPVDSMEIETIADIPVISAPEPTQAEINQENILEQLNNELTQKNQELAQKLQNADSTINGLNQTITSLQGQVSSLSNQEPAAAPKKPKTLHKSSKLTTKAPKKPQASSKGKWKLRAALPGKATIARENSNDLRTVEVGDRLDSIGKIQSISLENGKWIVQGTKGQIIR